jgi:hypothetical protein
MSEYQEGLMILAIAGIYLIFIGRAGIAYKELPGLKTDEKMSPKSGD